MKQEINPQDTNRAMAMVSRCCKWSSRKRKKKITLGVFDNNPSAFHCYDSLGFKVIGTDTYLIDGEEWTGKEMELD